MLYKNNRHILTIRKLKSFKTQLYFVTIISTILFTLPSAYSYKTATIATNDSSITKSQNDIGFSEVNCGTTNPLTSGQGACLSSNNGFCSPTSNCPGIASYSSRLTAKPVPVRNTIPGNKVRVVYTGDPGDQIYLEVVLKSGSKQQTFILQRGNAQQINEFTMTTISPSDTIDTIDVRMKEYFWKKKKGFWEDGGYFVGWRAPGSCGTCPADANYTWPSQPAGFQEASHQCWSDAWEGSSDCDFDDLGLKVYVGSDKFCNINQSYSCENNGTIAKVNWNITSKNFTPAQIQGAFNGRLFTNWKTSSEGDFSANFGTASSGSKSVSITPDKDYQLDTRVFLSAPNSISSNYICKTNAVTINCPAPKPPTSTLSFSNTNVCSTSWTGRIAHNRSNSQALANTGNNTNNPITITSTFTDRDGLNDIDTFGLWFSDYSTSNWRNNADKGLYIRLQRLGANNYRMLYYTNIKNSLAYGTTTIASGKAICTSGVNGNQSICQVNSQGELVTPDASKIGYILPISISESGNTITVKWKMGILDSAASVFNYDLKNTVGLYSFVADKFPYAIWTTGPTWRVDLRDPESTIESITPKTPTSTLFPYDVKFKSRDDISGLKIGIPIGYQNGFNAGESAFSWAENRNTYYHTFTNVDDGNNGNATGSIRNPYFRNYATQLSANYPWTLTYNFENIVVTDGTVDIELHAYDNACNFKKSTREEIEIGGAPWLMTTEGDMYTNRVNQEIYPDTISNTDNQYLFGQKAKTSWYMYLKNATTDAVEAGKKSLKNYNNLGRYWDLNYKPRQASVSDNWTTFLKKSLEKNEDSAKFVNRPNPENYIVNSNTSNFTSSYGGDNSMINVFNLNGSLTLNSNTQCNTKTVFIVNSLVINPDFRISDNSKGCMFIVRGLTTINTGTNKGSTINLAKYDLVDAFIITNKIYIPDDAANDGLLIKGGIILNTNNADAFGGSVDANLFQGHAEFKRILTLSNNQRTPSDAVQYDGTRYMYLFKDLFEYESKFIIREKQFIDALNS
jgi:hypothetical protein